MSCADGGVGIVAGLGFGVFRVVVFGVAVGLRGVDVGGGFEFGGSLALRGWIRARRWGRRALPMQGLEVVAFELDGVGAAFLAGCLGGGGRLGGVGFHGDLFLDGVVELAGHLLKLFDAGELVDVLEAEAEEEVLGGFVEDGAADDLLAAGGGDEFAGEQGAEDAGGVDATDLGDLGGGDGLLVGDDGEGFERLQGEL